MILDAKSTRVDENLIDATLHNLFAFLYLLIFNANVSQIWASFSGIMPAFSFMSSCTVAEVFDNVSIFLCCVFRRRIYFL